MDRGLGAAMTTRTAIHRSSLSRLRYIRSLLIDHLLLGLPVSDFWKLWPIRATEAMIVYRSMGLSGITVKGCLRLSCDLPRLNVALVLEGSSTGIPGDLVFSSPKEETFGNGSVSLRPELVPDLTYEFSAPLSKPERIFRHSGWARRREATWRLLSSPGVAGTNRLASFCKCGSEATVYFSPSTDNFRVRANYCHDRWCEPCMRARSGKIAASLREHAKGLHCRFLTLTLAHSAQSLKAQIDRLKKHFDTLRHSKEWKAHVTGGAVTLEPKLSDSGEWHPHLHILFAGEWWSTDEISALWRRITADSYIVKIKDCGDDLNRYVGYLCSYITKPNKAGFVYECPERLLEMMTALKGRRLVDLLGNWRGWVKDDDNAYVDPDDWRRVSTVDKLWAASVQGEQWAMNIMYNIARRFFRSPDVEESSPDLFSG